MNADFSLLDVGVWFIVFIFSTTVHEASHAFAGYRLGDDTAARGGQMTLDPTPHIRREPFGMVVVPLLFYFTSGYILGWASAPYNRAWAERFPKKAALMALAGPVSNLLLVLAAALLIHLGTPLHWWRVSTFPHGSEIAIPLQDGLAHLGALLLSVTFSLNLLLFCFNLLPLPPLDGSAIPLLLLSGSAASRYSNFLRHPALAVIGVIVGFRLFPQLFAPVQHFFSVLLLRN